MTTYTVTNEDKFANVFDVNIEGVKGDNYSGEFYGCVEITFVDGSEPIISDGQHYKTDFQEDYGFLLISQ